MPECGSVSSVRATQPCPSGTNPMELAQQLSQGAEKVIQSLSDPVARTRTRKAGQQMLEQGTALLRQIGDGPGSAELARGLRAMEGALSRLSPDEAAQTVPSRPRDARQQRLADQAQRSVNIGARALSRSGDVEDFANAVAGDMSDRHLRALGRLDTDDLRRTLRDNGVSPVRTEQAIFRLKDKIAGKYQRVIQTRAQTAMETNAARLERAMQPGSREQRALMAALMDGRGEELVQQLELAGADVSALRSAVAGAARHPGQSTIEQLQPLLAPALAAAVETIREQAEVVSEWSDEELYDQAIASETFPTVADRVRDRWAIDGVVGQAVSRDITQARARNHLEHQIFNGVFIAAAAIAGACTGGAAAPIITATGAVIREGAAVRGAWADADMAAAGANAGIVSTEAAAEARTRAQAETAAAVGAVAAEVAPARVMGEVHHALQGRLGDAAGNAATAAIEGAYALGVETGKHAGVAAATGDDHH